MNSDAFLDRQQSEWAEWQEQQRQDEEKEAYCLEEILTIINVAKILTDDQLYLLRRNLRLL